MYILRYLFIFLDNQRLKISYQIQKIKVCDSVKGLSSENKKWRNNNSQSQLRKITDKKGKLESYQRKTIIYGDGFHAPEQRIGKYEFEFLWKW